jgi:hypothetical protein
MAVRRAKKLKKEDFDNVQIIQKRLDLIEKEYEELGNIKVQHIKKINTLINTEYTSGLALEIGKIELYIDKKKASLVKFIKETDEQNIALAKDLQTKYGEGTINPEKGTFLPK